MTDVVCDVCGRNMVVKYGPHGKVPCLPWIPGMPQHKTLSGKNRRQMSEMRQRDCAEKTKKGRKYYGCENNPECDFMSWSRPVEEKCPEMRRLHGYERQQNRLRRRAVRLCDREERKNQE